MGRVWHTPLILTISCYRQRIISPLIVAYNNGAPVLLKDVAQVVDGVENNKLAAWMDQTPAVILNIQRQPGANTISVVKGIKQLLPTLDNQPPRIGAGHPADRPYNRHPSIRLRR